MQEYIEVRGARENNLKNISLRIPKRKITVFTGVSGSGKSSIVFDTIATEAQRLLNENFSLFVRNLLPRYSQPEADALENLQMAIVIDQKRMGGGARSTVGTVTDIYTILRTLYSRIGLPTISGSNVFSFNDPAGMCKMCSGAGRTMTVKMEKALDMEKSLNEGAILLPGFVIGTWYGDSYAYSGLFDPDKKLVDYTEAEMEDFLQGKSRRVEVKTEKYTMKGTYEGLLNKFRRLYIRRDISTTSQATQKSVADFTSLTSCPSCGGARLNPKALGVKVNGRSIAEAASLEADELITFLKTIDNPIVVPMVANLVGRLQHLSDIGLGYISLDRETDSLSGGESQRIKMVKSLSSALVDVMYIFDEPSVGLHPRDVHRLNELLVKLRDKGNTVIVVEHDPDVIRIADHIIDVGPLAGINGGQIMFEGSFEKLLDSETLTGMHMNKPMPIKTNPRQATDLIQIENTSLHNLKDVRVTIPTGILTVVTGVAGSGKSSLINKVFLQQHPEAISIDQSAVGANSRSNPATYTGIMDGIRKLFAKTNHVAPGLFSFNSKGACENCHGMGVIYTDLGAMEGVKSPCEVCNGRRFKDEVLAYKVHGKSIADVLRMTIDEAADFFSGKEIVRILESMRDVGIGYLTLGQSLNTLSGGECQRIKLAGQLHKSGSIYVMDEPTTGLHFSDIGNLLAIINRLVNSGNTVIVIEHNLDIIRNADWVIDLGPEGGHRGGQIMFEGTPEQLRGSRESLTAPYV